MARAFNGTSARIHVSSAAISALPFTLACWFRTTSMAHLGALVSVNSTTLSNHYAGLFFRGDIANDPVEILYQAATGERVSRSATGCTSGKWHHACAVFSSETERTVYLDGGSSGKSFTSTVFPTVDRTEIGAHRSGLWFNGDIAEVGIWNIDLSAAEIAALAKGVSPALIRPQNHIAYLPLIRETHEIVNATGFTDVNTTAAAHTRIYL